MILICGALTDPVTELVCARLDRSRYPYRLLDLATYPAGFLVNWLWREGFPGGYVSNKYWRLDLRELTGVYVRFLRSEERVPPKDIPMKVHSSLCAECDAGLMAMLESLPCPVVNRLTGAMSNNSKPYQAVRIRRCGLRTPATLITSDPEAARRFYEERGGQVVYKSISGVRSIVRRMNAEHLGRLPFLRDGPAQFQEFLPGDNIRVHTVGDRWFATRVRSEAVDYRYAYQERLSVEMEPTGLPDIVAAACINVARQFGLLLAGIDLKETAEGEYYCFEVNPSPAFLEYERRSGQPISHALAELLHGHLTIPARGEDDAAT